MWPAVVERTLSVFELDRVARSRLAALPWDVMKRVAVAEALVLQPDVILVDSNPADLVPYDTVTLRALAAYAEAGAAIVIAARDASAVASVAPRFILLEGGRNKSKPGRIVAERVH
jgi:ABC-type branched-subunit amino acid transport system ATPase component